MKEIIKGVSILIGTIVGGGIFALPYVFEKAGFLTSIFVLILISIAILILHLFYLEIIEEVKERHRFIGYMKKFLTKKLVFLVSIFTIFGFWASLLIYLILGLEFLKGFFLGQKIALILFGVPALILVYLGLKRVALIEILGAFFLIGFIVFLFGISFKNPLNKNLLNFDFKKFFLPYGAIIFSLYGVSALPEISDLLVQKRKISVILGTLIPALLYFLFAFSVLRTSFNPHLSLAQNLLNIFGRKVALIFYLFGFFSVFTSFLIVGVNLKESFCFDFSFPKNLAFSLAMGLPFLFYFFGVNNFLKVIDLCGTLFLGANSIFLLLAYLKLKRPFYKRTLGVFLILIFSFALVLYLKNFFLSLF